MQKHEHYLQRLLTASPIVYFLVYTASFGLVLWLVGEFIIRMPVAWWITTLQAVAYGGIMTFITWHTQRRTDAALGELRPDIEQRLELARALRTAKMPKDQALRDALPGYLDRIDKQNRRVRMFGPIEFVLFAGLAFYLELQSTDPIWYAFTGLFLGFGILCYMQPSGVLERSAALRKKLARSSKRPRKS